jgi:uncharacterized protein YjbI with pentapeptide repeats
MDFNLRSPKLLSRSFRGQNLSQANFQGADLIGADFTEAILDGANFSHADLRGASFRRSNLAGANLASSRLGVTPNRKIVLRTLFIILTILFGIFAGFAGSSTTGLLNNESIVFLPYQNIKFIVAWHTFAGILSIVYAAIYGLILLWKNPLTAIILGGAISIIIVSPIVTIILIYTCLSTHHSWITVGEMTIAIEGSAAINVFSAMFTTMSLAIVINMLKLGRKIIVLFYIGVILSAISATISNSSPYVFLGIFLASNVIFYLATKVNHRAENGDINYRFITRISTYISTYYGTCFWRANLTNATLASALIADSDLSFANLFRTNFHDAQRLELAKVTKTILVNPLIRDLLVSHQVGQNSYVGCDLNGAYLTQANLADADFTDADFSGADLSCTLLEHANLMQVLATGADFSGAVLTGACIANWSVDQTTNLANITCNYVYLLAPNKERNPASGSFAPGDFTKLFQDLHNTIDLIFHHGINWVAFGNTWQQIQVENAGVDVAIRGIEHKGDGLIVVKIDVPIGLDKANLHQEFNESYGLLLKLVEERHQIELVGRDRELAIYREQQNHLQNILQSLVAPPDVFLQSEQLVVLKLGAKDINNNLAVTVEIGNHRMTARSAAVGWLADASLVIAAYQNWQTAYRQYLGGACRLDIPPDQVTNLTRQNSSLPCEIAANNLQQAINLWLDGDGFKPVKELILQELQSAQSIQFILQTDDLQIRQLPLQLWNLFDRFSHAEMTVASNTYQATSCSPLNHISNTNLKILAIIGDGTGLDLKSDCNSLAQLPHAQVEFLIEPTRQILNDKLWSKAWDLVYFAGHSASTPGLATGHLKINATDQLTIAELKYALKQSIENGLKLMIINSCDGLGLATELLAMQLPQAIVMREPVPDLVAQQFLQNFLALFTSGLPLYRAVRSAREQLQGLEDRYPCATWLPVICQNPATR